MELKGCFFGMDGTRKILTVSLLGCIQEKPMGKQVGRRGKGEHAAGNPG